MAHHGGGGGGFHGGGGGHYGGGRYGGYGGRGYYGGRGFGYGAGLGWGLGVPLLYGAALGATVANAASQPSVTVINAAPPQPVAYIPVSSAAEAMALQSQYPNYVVSYVPAKPA